jgi:hypothetical protein
MDNTNSSQPWNTNNTNDNTNNTNNTNDTNNTNNQLIRSQRQNQSQKTSSQQSSSSFLSIVKKWRPTQTPKLTFSLLLYICGIFLAFFARPMPVSIEQFEKYEQKLRAIDEGGENSLGEQRFKAEELYRTTQRELYDSKRFGWRLRGGSEKMKVLELQKREKADWRALKAINKERDRKLRDAKSELSIWSDEGVKETKQKFWEKYEGGKVFATQQTFYDAFNSLLYGRSDQNALEFMIKWTFTILINFTVGMFGAVVGFIFALPSVIYGYGANAISFILFFILAVISAVSVVITLLGVLYGGAIGGVVGAINVATTNALRIEEKKREEAKRLMERQQQRHRRGAENDNNNDRFNRSSNHQKGPSSSFDRELHMD